MLAQILALLLFFVVGSHGSTPFSIPVEHSLDNRKFSPAGKIEGKLSAKGMLLGTPVLTRYALSKEELKSLQALASRDGYYRLQMPSILLDAGSTKVMASLRARCLQLSGFEENIRLELTFSNQIVGVDYRTLVGECGDGAPVPDDQPAKLFKEKVDVMFQYPIAAPYISVNDWGVPTASEDGDLEPGEKPAQDSRKPKKTWIQQNWMFVMAGAIIILQVLGSLGDDRTGQGGQGGDQGGASNRADRGGGRGGRGRR